MKHVYAVMVGNYNQHPATICQNEDDASNMAIALNSLNASLLKNRLKNLFNYL